MTIRKCPRCGNLNYSADTFHNWTCTKCGATIGKDNEVNDKTKNSKGE